MAPEDETDPPTIRILLNEAEMEAERMTGWVRVVLALALAVSLLGSGGIASVAGYDEFWARLGLGALAVAAFLALGVASLVLTRIGSYAPWMAFAFTAADAAIIVLAVGATLRDTGLGGNWIAIAPALWAAPLILAVGALRYRPEIQLWVTGLLVAGLGLVVAASGARRRHRRHTAIQRPGS